jgi:hypothetical protein
MSLSDFEPDELEGLQQKWPRIVGAMLDMERTIDTQAAEIERLRGELAEAVRVLRPFAVKINRTYDTSLTPDQIAKAEADDAICGFPFTNRQVRAAFAFITKHSGGGS